MTNISGKKHYAGREAGGGNDGFKPDIIEEEAGGDAGFVVKGIDWTRWLI